LGGGTLGGGDGATCGRALSCEVCTVDVDFGFERGASTVTCGNVAVFDCAGMSPGDGDVSDCAEGGSCVGAAGGDAGSVAAGGDAGWVVGAFCSGGDACAFTWFELAAANAR